MPAIAYALRSGVTYCQADGFTFFLDIERDRYFAISSPSAASFSRLAERLTLTDHDAGFLDALVEQGLLVAAVDPSTTAPCRHDSTPVESALDLAIPAQLKPPVPAAFFRIWRARRSLRRRGLARTLRDLAARKRQQTTSTTVRGAILDVAAAFERCHRLVSALDQCLPHSVAMAHRLIDVGVAPTLIMGIRAQPFGAHCWVEAGGLIVSDRYDTIRAFTPILTI